MGGFNARPLIVCALILLLLIGVGTGGYLAWPYLSQQFSALGAASGAQMEVVTGYMVRLGSRDLVVVEDRAGMENFVSSWLAQKNAAAQEGIVYRIAQDITYEEVRIDAAYCATLEEVENAFVKQKPPMEGKSSSIGGFLFRFVRRGGSAQPRSARSSTRWTFSFVATPSWTLSRPT